MPKNPPKVYKRTAKTPLPTVEQIEAALNVLIDARIRHDKERYEAERGKISDFKIMMLNEIGATEYLPGESFIHDPIKESLSFGVKQLGRALYALTNSTDVMNDVCERVCDRDPANWGRRADIMSKRWDGIGDWFA